MFFRDKLEIAGTRRRIDGSLLVDARAARTGIQLYRGSEVGKPELDIVRVYRSPDEVFSQDSLASFAHKAVTNDHPAQFVTSDTWNKSKVVGHTADEVYRDTIFVRVPLMVSDGEMISDIENGKRELSPGYECDLDFTPGKTQDGEQFDAQQRNIRVNHVAVVQNGRSGSKVRIGDQEMIAPMVTEKPKMPVYTIDGLPIEMSDVAIAAFKRMEQTVTARDATIAAKDETIGQLRAELVTAKAIDVNKLVADRVALIAHVGKIAPGVEIKPELSDADIRKSVVSARFGADLVKDASDAEIAGMFKTIVAPTQTGDTFRSGAMDSRGQQTPPADNGQAAFEKRLTDAWQGNKAA